jgi:hypothetical protein
VILDQGDRIARADGATPEKIRAQRETQKQIFDLVRTETNPGALRKKVRDLLRAQINALPEGEKKALGDPVEAAINQQAEPVLTPWFRYFLTYDPRPALTQLKVPVLVLNGERDLQVSPDLNLPQIAASLKTAKNRDVTLRRLPGLNHLFQHAKTGDISEYAKSEETLSPEVLEIVTKWISKRFGATAKSPRKAGKARLRKH